MSELVGNRFIVPVYRLFPIWRFGPRRNIFGERIEDGWYADRFFDREFAAEAEAQAFTAEAEYRRAKKKT